jgi:hypothetical protein
MFTLQSSVLKLAGTALFALAIACGCSDSDNATNDEEAAGHSGASAGSSSAAGHKGSAGNASTAGRMSSGSGGSSAKDAGQSTAGATAKDSGMVMVEPSDGVAVDLGGAGDYAILAMSGVSTVPTSAVTGNVGVSPAAATYITGFSLIADATNVFSTSTQVTGQVSAADYAVPTPATLTTAVGDMLLAFTDAAGRAPDVTELGAGDIGGMTLKPGVYKWGTGLLIPSDVTLKGSKTDMWIFQVAQDLTIESGKKVVLAGGALAKNIVWQVAGQVEIGTTAHCEGIILTKTSATLGTGSSLNGRVLAQTSVDIDSSTIVAPD